MLTYNPARFAPAIILGIGALLVRSSKTMRAVDLSMPLQQSIRAVPGYDVRLQRIGDDERRVSGMTDYVARIYTRDSVIAFTTLVAYYDRQSRGQSIHSPRNCLPGAGWAILSAGTATIPVADRRYLVNQYVVKNGPDRAVVYYWYQGRGRVVADEFSVKWNLLRDAALRGHTEEALVRIVVPVRASSRVTDGMATATGLGKTVAARTIEAVSDALPHDAGI